MWMNNVFSTPQHAALQHLNITIPWSIIGHQLTSALLLSWLVRPIDGHVPERNVLFKVRSDGHMSTHLPSDLLRRPVIKK